MCTLDGMTTVDCTRFLNRPIEGSMSSINDYKMILYSMSLCDYLPGLIISSVSEKVTELFR